MDDIIQSIEDAMDTGKLDDQLCMMMTDLIRKPGFNQKGADQVYVSFIAFGDPEGRPVPGSDDIRYFTPTMKRRVGEDPIYMNHYKTSLKYFLELVSHYDGFDLSS